MWARVGLPGIPLSIVRPESHFTLLDSLGKRVRFAPVQHELKLENITPVQSRVRSSRQSHRSTGLSAVRLLRLMTW